MLEHAPHTLEVKYFNISSICDSIKDWPESGGKDSIETGAGDASVTRSAVAKIPPLKVSEGECDWGDVLQVLTLDIT